MWHLVAAVVYHDVAVRFADHDKLRQRTPLGTFDSKNFRLPGTSGDQDSSDQIIGKLRFKDKLILEFLYTYILREKINNVNILA